MECAHCKKPDCQLACAGCKDCLILNGEAAEVRYCDATCQKADWLNHKPTCLRLKDRQLLYRVASTAQQLCYIFWELIWYTQEIQSVDEDDDELMMWKMSYPKSSTIERVLNLRGNDLERQGRYNPQYPVAIPFAATLLPEKRDQEAALSYNKGIQANTWMVQFIQGMLDNIVKKTVIVEHRTKGEKLLTRWLPNQKAASLASLFPMAVQQTKNIHYVLKVTLRSGEDYAIDLACAQHGHCEAVTPWKQFENERILNIMSKRPADAPKGLLRVQDYSPQKIDYFHREKHRTDALGKMIIDDILQIINLEILNWQANNMGLKGFWRLSETEFATKQKDLVDYIDWALNFTGEYKTVRGTELTKQRGKNWIHGTN